MIPAFNDGSSICRIFKTCLSVNHFSGPGASINSALVLRHGEQLVVALCVFSVLELRSWWLTNVSVSSGVIPSPAS